MRRALLAAGLLGAIAGLVFVNHDALKLTSAWPVIVGFALWDSVGRQGSRGLPAAAAGLIGLVLGFLTFGVTAQFLPVIGASLGIVTGIVVGLIVLVGVLAKDRLPLPGLLLGYATYFALFEPLWQVSAANTKSHGLDVLTQGALALLVGILAAASIRALVDPVGRRREAADADAQPASAAAREPDDGPGGGFAVKEAPATEGGAS